MAHISSRQVSPIVLQKIRTKFVYTITKIHSKTETQAFLGELLTHTEQIMLAKRLACIVLWSRGISGYSIARTLKLSESTVARITARCDTKKYEHIVSLCKKDTVFSVFLDTLEKVLGAGLPPIVGKGRWRSFG